MPSFIMQNEMPRYLKYLRQQSEIIGDIWSKIPHEKRIKLMEKHLGCRSWEGWPTGTVEKILVAEGYMSPLPRFVSDPE